MAEWDSPGTVLSSMREGAALANDLFPQQKRMSGSNIPIVTPKVPEYGFSFEKYSQPLMEGLAKYADTVDQVKKLGWEDTNKVMDAAASGTDNPLMKAVYESAKNVGMGQMLKPEDFGRLIDTVKANPDINNNADFKTQYAILKGRLGKSGGAALDNLVKDALAQKEKADGMYAVDNRRYGQSMLSAARAMSEAIKGAKLGKTVSPETEQTIRNFWSPGGDAEEWLKRDPATFRQWMSETNPARTNYKPDTWKNMDTGEIYYSASDAARASRTNPNIVKQGGETESGYTGRRVSTAVNLAKLINQYNDNPSYENFANLQTAYEPMGITIVKQETPGWTTRISDFVSGTKRPKLLAYDRDGNLIGIDESGNVMQKNSGKRPMRNPKKPNRKSETAEEKKRRLMGM